MIAISKRILRKTWDPNFDHSPIVSSFFWIINNYIYLIKMELRLGLDDQPSSFKRNIYSTKKYL
jgi:hypothetical protein